MPYDCGMNAFAAAMQQPSAPSLADVARALKVSPATVHQWRSGARPVPVARCAEVEKLFDHAITRRDLRPRDWQQIWPELAAASESSSQPA